MKFWELISVFKSEEENLISVFKKPKWERFRVNFENWIQIVNQQNREILDEEIPFDLAKEVCELSDLKFYLYFKSEPQILRSYKMETVELFEQVSPLEILLRFGGSYIEETLEKGSSRVFPKK